ncbi:MAG: dihydrodipicolinate synthase family protein, partial [Desulfurococcaceae archaeon]
YVTRFGDKYFIAGAGDSFLYYTFAIGASAHICGISNVVPELAVAIYESVIKGNHKKAIELQYLANKLRKALSKLSSEGQEAIREVLRYRGLNPGYPPVQMVHEFDPRHVEEARNTLQKVLEAVKR